MGLTTKKEFVSHLTHYLSDRIRKEKNREEKWSSFLKLQSDISMVVFFWLESCFEASEFWFDLCFISFTEFLINTRKNAMWLMLPNTSKLGARMYNLQQVVNHITRGCEKLLKVMSGWFLERGSYIDWFLLHDNLSGVISCLEIRELGSLYFIITIFVLVHRFFFVHSYMITSIIIKC